MTKRKPPLKAIRAKCLDCCCGSVKSVRYCPCDGTHSTWCPLWPYRFGMRPATAAAKYGRRFLAPELMPDSSVALEDCHDDRKDQADRPAAPPVEKSASLGRSFSRGPVGRADGMATVSVATCGARM